MHLFRLRSVFFCFSLDYFVLVLFAFVVSDLVSLVLCQEIGWEEHLRNDLFYVEWDVKLIIQSTKLLIFYILLISTYISEALLTI